MPRIECRIRCGFGTNVDVDRIGNDIANAIKSLTGNSCQVVINRRDTEIGRIGIFQMRQQEDHNQIVRPRR